MSSVAAADPFKISALVPTFERQMADYRTASAGARQRLRSELGIPYGPGSRQRLDLFFPPSTGRHLPIHLFIHGGYWRAQSKEDYAFAAEGVVAAGAIAALVEYTLMPGKRMADLVAEVRPAARWIVAHAEDFGADPAQFSASGHSAGAHLASYLVSRGPGEAAPPPARPRSLLLLSGLYDLRPLVASFLQDEVHFTPEEVAQWSPVDARPAAEAHVTIAAGAEESPPFHEQARAYADHLAASGTSVVVHTLRGHDHMSIVRDLGRPETEVGQLLAAMIERSRTARGGLS